MPVSFGTASACLVAVEKIRLKAHFGDRGFGCLDHALFPGSFFSHNGAFNGNIQFVLDRGPSYTQMGKLKEAKKAA